VTFSELCCLGCRKRCLLSGLEEEQVAQQHQAGLQGQMPEDSGTPSSGQAQQECLKASASLQNMGNSTDDSKTGERYLNGMLNAARVGPPESRISITQLYTSV